ncbi:MAG: 50S ribosomal protein L25 [Kiritimatiellia bacterium]
MVKEQVAFKAESRSADKKSALTRLRAEGFIPGVIYSKGAVGETVQLNEHDFNMMLKHHSGENLMIDLKIGSDSNRHVLIKDIQHHPMTARIVHVDFHEISLDRMIKVMVPLEFVGKPFGVTQGGGTLDVQTREIEVECKASDLVEAFEVEVSALKIGDHLTVADVKLPEGFELLTPEEISIATVLKPRVAADEGDEEDEVSELTEPEVITGASDEEEEEDDS